MRVLRIAGAPSGRTGGVSRFMALSGEALAKRDVDAEHLFLDDFTLARALAPARRIVLPWVVATRVLRLARGPNRPDVVEIHEPLAAPYAALRRLPGMRRLPPCVVMSHGLEERAWIARRERAARIGEPISLKTRIAVPLTLVSQVRLALRAASRVLVLSTEDAQFLTARRRIPPRRVMRINGGVDEQILSITRDGAPAMRLLFGGTWIDRKGTRELVAAWCRLRDGNPNLSLTLAGTGLSADRVLSDVPERFRDGVTVVASMDDAQLAHLLATHDVFLLPSWFEGMPLSMLEAAGAGLACVVTSVCGNIDVFRRSDPQADGAILIPPHSSEALVAAVRTLADNAQLRARLGENARRRAHEFTWAHTADQALAAYRAALDADSLNRPSS